MTTFLSAWINEIIVAFLTTGLIFLFKNYLQSFLSGLIQSAPSIKGIWDGFDIDENGKECQNSRMEIQQLGTKISATVMRKNQNGERIFKYHGTISHGQVLLIWKEAKSKGFNMGTMTLLLSGNMYSLTGKSTYNHHDMGRIISQDKVYKKQRI